MSWSYDEARALYQQCPSCGENFCVEDPDVREDYYGTAFCSAYCLEQDDRYHDDTPGHRRAWP